MYYPTKKKEKKKERGHTIFRRRQSSSVTHGPIHQSPRPRSCPSRGRWQYLYYIHINKCMSVARSSRAMNKANKWPRMTTHSHAKKRRTRTLVYGQRTCSSRQPCAYPRTRQTWAQTGPERRPSRRRPRQHSPHRPHRHGLHPCCFLLLMLPLLVAPRKSCL